MYWMFLGCLGSFLIFQNFFDFLESFGIFWEFLGFYWIFGISLGFFEYLVFFGNLYGFLGWGDVMALLGSITFFEKRCCVTEVHNTFSKATKQTSPQLSACDFSHYIQKLCRPTFSNMVHNIASAFANFMKSGSIIPGVISLTAVDYSRICQPNPKKRP